MLPVRRLLSLHSSLVGTAFSAFCPSCWTSVLCSQPQPGWSKPDSAGCNIHVILYKQSLCNVYSIVSCVTLITLCYMWFHKRLPFAVSSSFLPLFLPFCDGSVWECIKRSWAERLSLYSIYYCKPNYCKKAKSEYLKGVFIVIYVLSVHC